MAKILTAKEPITLVIVMVNSASTNSSNNSSSYVVCHSRPCQAPPLLHVPASACHLIPILSLVPDPHSLISVFTPVLFHNRLCLITLKPSSSLPALLLSLLFDLILPFSDPGFCQALFVVQLVTSLLCFCTWID